MKQKKMTNKVRAADLVQFVPPPLTNGDELIVQGLRQNNLKDLSFTVPHNKITAVVGPSGSGKSSLAFDTLFAEGRWRFIESLSTYSRLFLERMDRPDVDLIQNIRPAVAIEQKNPVRTSRSTVATATELYDYLRLLYARAGTIHCPECDNELRQASPALLSQRLIADHTNDKIVIGYTIMPEKGLKGLLAELLKKGLFRVIIDGVQHDLSGGLPVDLTNDNLSVMVICDRLLLKEKERARLAASLELAYHEGSGKLWVQVGNNKKLLHFTKALKCLDCDIGIKKPTPILFSFNHPLGACPECKGFGNILRYSEERVIQDDSLSLRDGAIEPWTKPSYRWWYEEMEQYGEENGLDLDIPFRSLSEAQREIVFSGTADFVGIDGFFEELERKKYKLHIRVFLSRYKGQNRCPECLGTRLKKEALSVKVGGLTISDLTSLTIEEAREFFIKLDLPRMKADISREPLKQTASKLEFLCKTGLGYITLSRLTRTLSGGEAQRVSLANQMGSALSGVLYILDEPSIGLHPRDIDKLVAQIVRLKERQNTVVLVEHDRTVMNRADHILELGPGAGTGGGRLVYAGPRDEFLKKARTITADYLTGRSTIAVPRWRRSGKGDKLSIRGASGNNLKNVKLEIPLKTVTCITGVSGSGKSTLIIDTLYRAVAAELGEKAERPLPFDFIDGTELLSGVKLINQEPIGRTPRSNPITYLGGFDEIRRFFSTLPEARSAALSKGAFSFNVPGGRCESCKGEGSEKLEMYFLPDVYVECGACAGKRFKPQVLDVKDRGKNIFDALEMTFADAAAYFPHMPALDKRFDIIREVGLSYLKLGQPATTLSGGEAQRLKIARELVTESGAGTIYILDEPTTGLHMVDIKKLLSVLGGLADAGNTVVIVEHNLDCVKSADHVIDLGPEGGERGGEIIARGTPEEVAACAASHTGRYLKELL